MLMQKGVYPLKHMDSSEHFVECKLPPKQASYNKISNVHISDKDYTHAQKVWETFKCLSLGDYSYLYCQTDVFFSGGHLWDLPEDLLAAVWSGLSSLLHEPWPLMGHTAEKGWHGTQAVEKRMWAGISMLSKHHAKVNNPQVEGYEPEKLNSHILYLYRWAMSQALPTVGFGWVGNCEQLAEEVIDHPANSLEAFIFKMDLEYPEGLHDMHNAYPMAPECMMVLREWLSEYQHDLLGVGMVPTEVEKLVPNLRNKECYVLHYHNLQLYISLGMRMKKIHFALHFEQSPSMEPYIQMNT